MQFRPNMEQSNKVSGNTSPVVEKLPEATRMAESGGDASEQHLREGYDEPPPHLHAKTFLAVLAICLLYFTQNFCIVGAGAVS